MSQDLLNSQNTSSSTATKSNPINPRLLVPGIHLAFLVLVALIGFADESLNIRNDHAVVTFIFFLNMFIFAFDFITFIVLLFFKKFKLAFSFLFSSILIFIVGCGLCVSQIGF